MKKQNVMQHMPRLSVSPMEFFHQKAAQEPAKQEKNEKPVNTSTGPEKIERIRLDSMLKPHTFRVKKYLLDKIITYDFWTQKGISETVNEALKRFFQEIEKDGVLPTIPEDKNILKHLEGFKDYQNKIVKTIQEPAIK